MKKPVLLLVDDDPAVLAALEAELTPAFGEICLVEAFESPADALAALPAWRIENRSVALAIIDQKMPGLTGVEFLEKLREQEELPESGHRARTRAILLTGYAGLESAVAAKNAGGADRYIEKPWSLALLNASIGDLLSATLEEAGFLSHAVFREVKSSEEISQVMALRFSVYSTAQGPSHLLRQDIAANLDVDAYDALSRLFVLEVRDGSENKLIGTLRLTGDAPAPALAAMKESLAAWPSLLDQLLAVRAHPLPCMAYLPDRDAVAEIVAAAHAVGEEIVEAGRLALSSEYRSAATSGVGARLLAKHIIEGAIGFTFSVGVEHTIVACSKLHVLLYRPYGFRIAEGTQIRFLAALEEESACLHGRISWVPEATRARCSSLSRRIVRHGLACTCSNFSDCQGRPYEDGNFTGTDVFCPLRARAILSGIAHP